jgi:hypothetical protein
MMAVFLNTIFGHRVYATSTFGEALFTLFKMLVFGDDTELYFVGVEWASELWICLVIQGLVSA